MEINEEEYFEDLLGKECNAKRKNKTGGCGKNECKEACEKIGIALEKTQELHKTAIASDWQHNFCFWAIEFVLFGFYGYFLLKGVDDRDDSLLLIAFLLSLFGLFIAIIYNYISLTSKTWQKNWEKHIHILEDYDITDKLHNFAFTPKSFFSFSDIDRTIILIIKVAWIFFALLSSLFLLREVDEPWPLVLFPLVFVFYFASDFTLRNKLNSETLEKELLIQVNENLEDMRVLKYNPQRFKTMLTEVGARRAITELLNKPNASEELTRLWELGRMDLSMEALIVENTKFHSLFPPEQIAKASKLLNDYDYET